MGTNLFDVKFPYENFLAECRAEIARQQVLLKDLHEPLGVSKANLSKKLAGERNLKVVEAIHLSKALNVPLSELFRRAEQISKEADQ